MKIYVAAPVVGNSSDVQEQIHNVVNVLKNKHARTDVELYLPSQIKIPNAWGMTMQEWGHCVFTVDVLELDRADWVVVCDFGRHNTAGTSWECGYAFGKGKSILVVRMPGVEEQSLMVTCCAANEISYEDLMRHKDDPNFWSIFVAKGRQPQKWEVTLN